MDFAYVYLVALTVFSIYLVGISLMTTQVSYPLYASVPSDAFVAYHARYNRLIQPVIIAPGFPTFLACTVFPLFRPDGVADWAALLIATGGLIALTATLTAAIPAHLSLQRDGFTEASYRRLRNADAVRTLACVLSAALLVWSALDTFTPG